MNPAPRLPIEIPPGSGSQPEPGAASSARLPSAAHLSEVTLRVADLERSLAYYGELIGLQIVERIPRRAVLGAGGRAILNLDEVPGARPQPPVTTGLYHTAILFPDRTSLARKIIQLSALRTPMVGYADHLVSEAFYFTDPDGNGLELYRDRPPAEWTWQAGQVQMDNAPIDFDSFFGEVDPAGPALADPAVPPQTRLGHLHLRIADLQTARRFYDQALGFDLVARFPGALFLSAGGYHHHLGMNVWESRGGPPAPPDAAGLSEYTLALPDQDELERVVEQLQEHGTQVEPGERGLYVSDPFQNRVRLMVIA